MYLKISVLTKIKGYLQCTDCDCNYFNYYFATFDFR